MVTLTHSFYTFMILHPVWDVLIMDTRNGVRVFLCVSTIRDYPSLAS